MVKFIFPILNRVDRNNNQNMVIARMSFASSKIYRITWPDSSNQKKLNYKGGCVFLMEAEFGRNDHGENASHFIIFLRLPAIACAFEKNEFT